MSKDVSFFYTFSFTIDRKYARVYRGTSEELWLSRKSVIF